MELSLKHLTNEYLEERLEDLLQAHPTIESATIVVDILDHTKHLCKDFDEMGTSARVFANDDLLEPLQKAFEKLVETCKPCPNRTLGQCEFCPNYDQDMAHIQI